jgi:hypothetical protein
MVESPLINLEILVEELEENLSNEEEKERKKLHESFWKHNILVYIICA